MKIAVPYQDGKVFSHFEKSKRFKIYETRSTFILESEVIEIDYADCQELALRLKEQEIGIVICDNIEEEDKSFLALSGIQVLSGAEGDADGAVKACLSNELKLKPKYGNSR